MLELLLVISFKEVTIPLENNSVASELAINPIVVQIEL